MAPLRRAPQLPLPAVPHVPAPGRRRPHLPLKRALEADGALERGFSPTLFAWGADAFNGGCFWEAHECWELLWRREPRGVPRRRLLQGLILMAAARVKLAQGRPEGAAALHRKALALLSDARQGADLVPGFDVAAMLARTSGDVTAPAPFMAHGWSPRRC